MENFVFYNPTKIEFGKGKEKIIGQRIAEYGIKKVLLCYGSERIKRDGLFDVVKKSLEDNGVTFLELGGIVSNPILSKVREGIDIARNHRVEGILAVGGGSVLDSSKAIAAGTTYQGDIWDLFTGKTTTVDALPLFDIITMAATGSEMNSGGVVTNEATKEKFALSHSSLYPKCSVINPELMKSISKDYLVYSATDIIAHVIEGYFTASVQPHLQSRIVESIIKTVIETTEILLKKPEDYDARAEFAWASTLALNGIPLSGTGGGSFPNHMIEHSLSALFNVPHGAGLSIVIPAWMKWYCSQNKMQFERFARVIFNANTAEEGIAALESWFNKIGTPTRLEQFTIAEKDLPEITENALKNAKAFGISTIYTKEIITTILQKAL